MERNQADSLIAVAEAVVSAETIPELADASLEAIATMTASPVAFVYLGDERLCAAPFYQLGLPDDIATIVREACAERFHQSPSKTGPSEEPLALALEAAPSFALFPLECGKSSAGFLGLAQSESLRSAVPSVRTASGFFGQALAHQLYRLDCEKQIKDLNTYLNVSTMITQALDLRDVLEAVLYFCMDHVSAEAASVLLLDYEKENLRFYSAEGPTKPVILMSSFPADQGLAGSVLQTQEAEIINDVQSDPRFYGKFDADSDFVTRSMIVIPLTAGEEKIGVLEIINKVDDRFSQDDLLFLQTVAEEVAFAIRNAKLFEVVVKSYCKQRQGLNTCRGCKRPLGSWTPCVKYREEAGILEV